jgi:hypothetical protein
MQSGTRFPRVPRSQTYTYSDDLILWSMLRTLITSSDGKKHAINFVNRKLFLSDPFREQDFFYYEREKTKGYFL